jgi:ferredoxin
MGEDIYRRLQQQLHQYSMGFPRTESGVELRILRSLFSEDDADLFLQMTPALEAPDSVASRLARPIDHVARLLDDMAERGLLFRLRRGDVSKYGAIPFVHGIFEFQVKDLAPDLAAMVTEYFDEAFDESMRKSMDYFLRTVPVDQSIDTTRRVASYDDAIEMLKTKHDIVVTNCICRARANMLGEGCDKPIEACFMFGSMGRYYLDRGMGRAITLDEAISIMEACREAGLVAQPATSQNPGGMCNCCGDCCGPLVALNKHPRPAELVFSNYVAALDGESCTGCEECLQRCQMNALTMNGEDEVAALDVDRCIGCGLCVTACPTEALSLEPKPGEQQRVPPENTTAQMMAMATKRGVL